MAVARARLPEPRTEWAASRAVTASGWLTYYCLYCTEGDESKSKRTSHALIGGGGLGTGHAANNSLSADRRCSALGFVQACANERVFELHARTKAQQRKAATSSSRHKEELHLKAMKHLCGNLTFWVSSHKLSHTEKYVRAASFGCVQQRMHAYEALFPWHSLNYIFKPLERRGVTQKLQILLRTLRSCYK